MQLSEMHRVRRVDMPKLIKLNAKKKKQTKFNVDEIIIETKC